MDISIVKHFCRKIRDSIHFGLKRPKSNRFQIGTKFGFKVSNRQSSKIPNNNSNYYFLINCITLSKNYM